MKTSDIARFWSYVAKAKPTECWNWTGGLSRGYGVFSLDGGPIGSHRAAAIITFGFPPNGEHVLHSCDNKRCCNPSHLRYGFPLDNVRDAIERGLHVMPPIYDGPITATRGADVWNATLTEAKVRDIWRLHLAGKNTAEIASATKSPRNAVVDVCRGRTWRHLSGAPSTLRLAKGGIRRSKLTPQKIKTAKRLIKEGLSNKEIGAILGTSPTPISYLRNYGTTWRPKP